MSELNGATNHSVVRVIQLGIELLCLLLRQPGDHPVVDKLAKAMQAGGIFRAGDSVKQLMPTRVCHAASLPSGLIQALDEV
ncbi:hypothetical protein ACTHPH_11215 [Paenibacillus pasadenensis]|uniref:hypothetical protein n=1 Tax=Paenibacillus TaxID=44249 RepID=UPI0003FF5840|nr:MULTISPECIES: hypothetical protein [Paenibacillus]